MFYIAITQFELDTQKLTSTNNPISSEKLTDFLAMKYMKTMTPDQAFEEANIAIALIQCGLRVEQIQEIDSEYVTTFNFTTDNDFLTMSSACSLFEGIFKNNYVNAYQNQRSERFSGLETTVEKWERLYKAVRDQKLHFELAAKRG